MTTQNAFDLFRLTKSKKEVDLCSNTLRDYFRRGLPYYRQGKAIFVSRTELATFIRTKQFTRGTQEKKQSSPEPGFLYVMQSGDRYKIGISKNPFDRHYGLKTADPGIIFCGAVFSTNPPRLEKYWHSEYESKHIDREWFALDQYDVQRILSTNEVPQ